MYSSVFHAAGMEICWIYIWIRKPDLLCAVRCHATESGVPLAIVKNILGHTSIQTTQIYLDISQQTVDRSMEKWNEKWFSKNNPDETALPQEEESIPAFLK